MIEENISKRITSVRFLLIVFVVFIHNNVTEVTFVGGTETYIIPIYVNIIRELFSNIIGRIAVPLFFLISGYLLYIKEITFLTNLKKKSRTILLPYILWNLLVVLFFLTAQNFNFTKPYFSGDNNLRDYNFIEWIDVFVGKFTARRQFQYPLVYQFWFLRDLFILNLLFIGIKKLINRFPFSIFVLFSILWISDTNIYIVSTEALLFFSLGYYIVKYSPSIEKLDLIKIHDVVPLYLITIVAELFFREKFPIIHKVNIIVGSIFFIKLTLYFIQDESIYKWLTSLEKYAFFVYAVHGILLATMVKLYVRIMPMRGAWLLLQYFGIAFICIVILVLLGKVFKKLLPKIYGILTGGRI